MRFKDKSVIVTGGARGIGRKIGEYFLREGANVVLADIDAALIKEVEHELRSESSRVIGVKVDVSKREDVHAAVETCIQHFGQLDVMVAHAGIAAACPLLEISDESWQQIMNINLTGAFLSVQEAGREMAKRGGGTIVVTSSTNSFWVESNLAHYNTSKGGVVAFVRSAAIDLAPYGIRVNGVAPGIVRTRISDWVINHSELSNQYLKQIPLKRFGEPEDVANTVLFLASGESAYITGQTIIIDGGQTLGITVDEPEEPIAGSQIN